MHSLYLLFFLFIIISGEKNEAISNIDVISYKSLQSYDKSIMLKLRSSLTKNGLFAVVDIPNQFEEIRKNVLKEMADCIPIEKETETILQDGTRRDSIGASSQGLQLGNINRCLYKGLSKTSDKILIQKIVLETFKYFLKYLDEVTSSEGKLNISLENSNNHLNTIDEVFRTSTSLEHFHVYTKNDTESRKGGIESLPSLNMHTDAGLLIGFIPSLLFGSNDIENKQGGDFFYENSVGKVENVIFPNNGDCIVFMIGDGFNQLINPNVNFKLRPVPHMVRVPNTGQQRSWYGRMFLPPNLAIMQDNQSFQSIRSKQISMSKLIRNNDNINTQVGGCSSPSLNLKDQAGTCPDKGDVYCWMACVSEATYNGPCSIGKKPICVHRDKSIWTPSQGHCSDCNVKCLSSAKPKREGNEYCNGFGTTMYMEGFTGFGNKDTACLVLLFPIFTLDNPYKFGAGALAVFFFGIFVEYLTYLRRKLSKEKEPNKVLKMIMYMIQLISAYIAMLFTMSFSTWIFLSIIFGLVFGYVVFNIDRPVQEFAEPCCSAVMDNENYNEYETLN